MLLSVASTIWTLALMFKSKSVSEGFCWDKVCLSHNVTLVFNLTQCHKLRVLPNHWNSKSDWPGRRYSKNITVESWTVRSWRRANNLFSSTIFWKCVWEKSLILCLDHISALCNKKQISLLMAKELKARKRLYTMFFHDILFVVSVLKNMIGFPTAQVLRTWGGGLLKI